MVRAEVDRVRSLSIGTALATSLSKKDVNRVQLLIEHAELQSVQFHEYGARRFSAPVEDIESDEANVNVEVQHRIDETSFGIRLNCSVRVRAGEATVSVAVEYDVANAHKFTKRDVLMFANEVAVMTAFPFLREGVSDVTRRVFGDPILLPIAPRGTIAFEIEKVAAVAP